MPADVFRVSGSFCEQRDPVSGEHANRGVPDNGEASLRSQECVPTSFSYMREMSEKELTPRFVAFQSRETAYCGRLNNPP